MFLYLYSCLIRVVQTLILIFGYTSRIISFLIFIQAHLTPHIFIGRRYTSFVEQMFSYRISNSSTSARKIGRHQIMLVILVRILLLRYLFIALLLTTKPVKSNIFSTPNQRIRLDVQAHNKGQRMLGSAFFCFL